MNFIIKFFLTYIYCAVMTRGTFSEIVKCTFYFRLSFVFVLQLINNPYVVNFELFDIKSKGWIDSFDLLRMLQSVYGMYKDDKSFYKRVRNKFCYLSTFLCVYLLIISTDTLSGKRNF